MTVPPQLLVAAPDDAGAQTADRYDWQALTAAVDCLACVIEHSAAGDSLREDICLICEHHEDYIVCVGDAIELVSAKHRDLSQGSWTYATLFTDGGIAHLFLRWAAFHEQVTARLVTNAGLNAEAAKLRGLCELLRGIGVGPLRDVDWQGLLTAAGRILTAIPPTKVLGEWKLQNGDASDVFIAAARRFLSALAFDCERPPRGMLPSAAVSMYVIPFLEFLGRNIAVATSTWEKIASLFRLRMRGHTEPGFEGMATVIANIHNLTADERLQLRLHQRAIWVKDVVEVVNLVADLNIAPIDQNRMIAPTRLALKLINAGCQDTTIHAAEAAAQRWRSEEMALSEAGIGVGPALQRVKGRALLLASEIHESHAQSASPGNDYGPQMWVELKNSITASSFDDTSVIHDDDLALGVVCDLASQCQVWLSSAFDLDMARAAFPNRLTTSANIAEPDNEQ